MEQMRRDVEQVDEPKRKKQVVKKSQPLATSDRSIWLAFPGLNAEQSETEATQPGPSQADQPGPSQDPT